MIFYVFVEILSIYIRLNMTHVIVKQSLQIPLCILISTLRLVHSLCIITLEVFTSF